MDAPLYQLDSFVSKTLFVVGMVTIVICVTGIVIALILFRNRVPPLEPRLPTHYQPHLPSETPREAFLRGLAEVRRERQENDERHGIIPYTHEPTIRPPSKAVRQSKGISIPVFATPSQPSPPYSEIDINGADNEPSNSTIPIPNSAHTSFTPRTPVPPRAFISYDSTLPMEQDQHSLDSSVNSRNVDLHYYRQQERQAEAYENARDGWDTD